MVRSGIGILICSVHLTSSAEVPNCPIQRKKVGEGQVKPEWVTGYPSPGGIARCRDDDTFSDMHERCKDFCGPLSVPLIMGTKNAGLNYENMEQICLGTGLEAGDAFMLPQPDALAECKTLQGSLDQLHRTTGLFIDKWDSVQIDQHAYRAELKNKSRLIAEYIRGEWGNEGLIGKLAGPEKLRALQEELYGQIRAKFETNNVRELNLKTTIDQLVQDGQRLEDATVTLGGNIDKLITNCLGIMPIVTVENVYLLDMCSTDSQACLENQSSAALHVGCCCGTVPGVGPTIAAGTGMSTTPQGGGGRRMIDNRPAGACSVAKPLTLDHLEETRQDFRDKPDVDQGFQEFEDHYNLIKCDGEAVGGRRLRDFTSGRGSVTEEFPKEFDQVGRGLQTVAICPETPEKQTLVLPQSDPDADPITIFPTPSQTEKQCMDIISIGQPDSEQRARDYLRDQCFDFCGEAAVALEIGDTRKGFTHAEIDSVCLSPGSHPDDDPQLYDKETVDLCHNIITRQIDLHTKIVQFAADLEAVQLAKVAAEARIAATIHTLNKALSQNIETTLKDSRKSEKVKNYLGLLAAAKDDFTNSDEPMKKKLKLRLESLKSSANELVRGLQTFKEDNELFLRTCDKMVTGVDRQKYYLLDQCAASGRFCLTDPEDGQRRACCCGYIPLSRYAALSVDHSSTIPGMAGVSGGRRMQEDDGEIRTVCGDVSVIVAPIAEDLVQQVRRFERDNDIELTDYQDAIKGGYCIKLEPERPRDNRNDDNNPSGGDGNDDPGADDEAGGGAGGGEKGKDGTDDTDGTDGTGSSGDGAATISILFSWLLVLSVSSTLL